MSLGVWCPIGGGQCAHQSPVPSVHTSSDNSSGSSPVLFGHKCMVLPYALGVMLPLERIFGGVQILRGKLLLCMCTKRPCRLPKHPL